MAKRRSASRRRRRKKSSHLPAILFAAIVATVAGYLLVQASDEGPPGSAPLIGVETSDPRASSSADSVAAGDSSDQPASDSEQGAEGLDPSNLGKPVKIFSDALGDLDIDQVIEDWTPVDSPPFPTRTAEILPTWVRNGRIETSLPDGYYWGIPINTFDEDERGINFDIRQVFSGDACLERFGSGDDTCLNDYQVVETSGTQLYPSYLADLLFVSFSIIERSDSLSGVAVVPSTFWSLLASGEPVSVTVPMNDPEPPSVAIANSPFLLTIVDGAIIAAQGIWIP